MYRYDLRRRRNFAVDDHLGDLLVELIHPAQFKSLGQPDFVEVIGATASRDSTPCEDGQGGLQIPVDDTIESESS